MGAADTDLIRLPHDAEVFIGSRWVAPSSDAKVTIISSATEEAVYELPAIALEDAASAVTAAREAFDSWNAMPFEERREIVVRFCAGIRSRFGDIARAWAIEAGMPLMMGELFNTSVGLILDDMTELSKTVAMSEVRHTPAGPVQVLHEGIGPTLAIITYNGPHTEIALAVVPGLMAGNTFIVKLPPENQMLGYFLAEAAAEAGFPPGVISIIAADADVSRFLVAHDQIDAVHFTGGTEVGVEIVKACAPRVARVTLELGGKSAAIIADDANLDTAIPSLVAGMTAYCGQVCVSMTRILVPRSRHDEIVRRMVDALRAIEIGDPLLETTQYGPLAAKRVRERAEGFIERAVHDGAIVAYGGGRPIGTDRGWFLEPTLLVNVTNAMEVAQSEIFGPVYCVIPYDGIDEAIDIANDSRYGLCGSVFTEDADLAADVARRVRVGTFAINAAFPCMTAPFGGVKQSGFGREGGREAFYELTSIKSITLPAASVAS